MENQSHDDSNRENVSPTWIPQLGMTFSTLEEARKFWGYYGGRNGFSIRQRYKNKSNIVKNPRAETRTGCPVRMTLSINREVGNWAISDLFLEHNHILQLPEACHLLPSQRMISEVQAHEIEIADASGIAPKAAHEFAILLNAQMTTPSSNDSLAAARLKKKEVNKEDKSSKRRRSWTERQHKGKKIGPTKTTAPLSKGKKKKKKELKTKQNHPAERTLHEVSHEYAHIANFTELLNMPSSEPSIGEDIF